MPEDIKEFKVLVVEDDLQLRKFMKLILENKFQFKVFEAENGKIGMEVVEKEKPNLILLDLMMPEVTGSEFLANIRQKDEFKDISVIVCSAVSDKKVISELVRYGISDFILKPVTPTQLTNKIGEFLKKYQAKLESEAIMKGVNLQ